ncbi:MAG TPA: hypothetical protein VGS80_07260 [Ktedonobacterales bacterium]|nr:hypothetical protein [Ktedonobacterales bacterium]
MSNNNNNTWRTTLSAAGLRARETWHTLRLRAAQLVAPPAIEPELPPAAVTAAPGSPLYQHSTQRHQPRNVNQMHRREQQSAGFNTRVAVWLTRNVGTMQCAYIFAGIGIGSLVGVATNNVVLAALFGSLSSYFLQLVLLPILSVGQNVLGRHAELQADEMFKTSQRSFHDIEEIMAHLSAQDDELLKQTKLLLRLCGEPVAAEAAASLPAAPAPIGPKASARRRTHS